MSSEQQGGTTPPSYPPFGLPPTPPPPGPPPGIYPGPGPSHPASTPPAPPLGRPDPLGHPSLGAPPAAVWVPPTPTYPYTRWIRRVGAYLIDFAPSIVAAIPFWVGYVLLLSAVYLVPQTGGRGPVAGSPELSGRLITAAWWLGAGGVLLLAALGWQWYNRWLTAGRTGQSLGKRFLRTRLLGEATGQPIGPVNAFVRDLLHILDGVAYVGYLWPLWDDKRQTFADMIMRTVVADLPPESDAATASPDAGQHGTPDAGQHGSPDAGQHGS